MQRVKSTASISIMSVSGSKWKLGIDGLRWLICDVKHISAMRVDIVARWKNTAVSSIVKCHVSRNVDQQITPTDSKYLVSQLIKTIIIN